MEFLTANIRRIILTFSICLAGAVYLIIRQSGYDFRVEVIRLTEWYGLAALAFLYLTLLLSPLYQAFPKLPNRPLAMKSLQSLGLSAFFFAALHACLSFFYSLGGFKGLGFLPGYYLWAGGLGLAALIILTLMAATSLPFIAQAMGKWWKRLQRLVYLAGLLIFVHALILGNHFVNWSDPLTLVILIAILFLFVLQFLRLDRSMSAKYPSLPPRLTAMILSFVLLMGMYLLFTYGPKLGIHSH